MAPKRSRSNESSSGRTSPPKKSKTIEMADAGSSELLSAVYNLPEDQFFVHDDNLDPFLLATPPQDEQLNWAAPVTSVQQPIPQRQPNPEQVGIPTGQPAIDPELLALDPMLLDTTVDDPESLALSPSPLDMTFDGPDLTMMDFDFSVGQAPALQIEGMGDFAQPIESSTFNTEQGNLDFSLLPEPTAPSYPEPAQDAEPLPYHQANVFSSTGPGQMIQDISSWIQPNLAQYPRELNSNLFFDEQPQFQELPHHSVYPTLEEAAADPGIGPQPMSFDYQPPAPPNVETTYANPSPANREDSPKNQNRALGPLRGGKRTAKINNFQADRYYQPLPRIPSSWGGPELNGEPRFQYNEHGEIDTDRIFTPEQIQEYLYGNPRQLVLWVQTCPSDSSRRYPSSQSDKCRFINCPVKNRTIHKGAFRVAFDEHPTSKIKLDPYHCAGYVHLFCLEKFLDFPTICKRLTVRPDNRDFPEGKNRMAVTRDHSVMYTIVEEFKQDSQPSPNFNYEETLCCKLTAKHLALEPEIREYSRQKRGGNHIGIHRGDLDKYAAFEKTKQRKNPWKSGTRGTKRKNQAREEEDEEEDEVVLTDPFANQDAVDREGRTRAAKRSRKSPETSPRRKSPRRPSPA